MFLVFGGGLFVFLCFVVGWLGFFLITVLPFNYILNLPFFSWKRI